MEEKKSSVFTHRFCLFPAYSQFLPVFRCHHVIVLLVTGTHIIQVTQNVTSIANFNLVLHLELESTEHRAQGSRLESSYTRTVEAGVWRDEVEEGRALSITKVSKSFHNSIQRSGTR